MLELSKSSSVSTEPEVKSIARDAKSVVRLTCTTVPLAGALVNVTCEEEGKVKPVSATPSTVTLISLVAVKVKGMLKVAVLLFPV
tara:strand:- start:2025 stop:2279 length:255 start_codon:yes stop_codon:yes gene_type:complete